MQLSELAAIAIEGVNDVLPELTESTDTLNAIFKDNGRAVKVGQKAYRLPMKYAKVGTAGIVSLDGGTLPRGGAPKYNYGSITPLAWAVPVEWTLLVQLAGTKADKLAVQNAVDQIMADATDMIKVWRDVAYHTDGTGTIATVDAYDGAGKTITLKSLPFGARLLRPGQIVDIYNGTAKRGTITIDQVYNTLGTTQKFTWLTGRAIDNGGTGIASCGQGDYVKFSNVTDGAPVWVNGLPSMINTSTSGSLLGITKASAPYTVSNGYDMGGAQISLPALRLIINQVKNRVGPDALKNQFFYTHSSQVAAYEELGFPLQMITSGDGNFGDLNLLFSGKKKVDQFPIVEGIHADQQSWYFLNPANWGKAKYGEPPFWFEGAGGKVLPLYDTTTGTPTTTSGSWLVDSFNAYCDNVLTQGVISTAKVPSSNYDSSH